MAKDIKEVLRLCQEYEDKQRKEGLLYLNKGGKEVSMKTGSLQEFLIDFFYHNHLSQYDTGSSRDFDCTSIVGTISNQCYAGARRSIGDLWRLAAHYYNSEVKLTDIMLEVMNMCNNSVPIKDKKGVYTSYIYTNVCGTIYRRVFNTITKPTASNFSTSNNTYNYNSSYSKNEFAIVMEDYLTLKAWADSEEQRKLKEQKEAERKLKESLANKSLDELVAEKLASILQSGDDKVALVKKAPTKRKKAA